MRQYSGLVSWFSTKLSEQVWMPEWSRFTAGLPYSPTFRSPGCLAFWDLAVEPGTAGLPKIFRWLALLVLGAILCFLTMRVWTGLATQTGRRGCALLRSSASITGWVIILPSLDTLVLVPGAGRWPYPFMILNLLLLGGLLGLTAYHTEPRWVLGFGPLVRRPSVRPDANSGNHPGSGDDVELEYRRSTLAETVLVPQPGPRWGHPMVGASIGPRPFGHPLGGSRSRAMFHFG